MKKNKTLDYLFRHQTAFQERLYLVASENSLIPEARLAFLTDVVNRYYFPLEEYRFWAFPGNEYLESIYTRCTELLKKRTGAAYVNIRPISGINAMTIALAALCRDRGTIATFAPENGGHSITHNIARRLGIKTVYVPYDQRGFRIESSALSTLVRQNNVSLLYLDQAHILFPLNLTEVRAALPDTVKIYYDGSHVMGLILGRQFQNPLTEGATFLGGNTHKTIPGPHKAFIATNNETEFKKIDEYSKLFVSHDHAADVAALSIVLEEMDGKWESYAKQVVRNAQYFAHALSNRGFTVAAKELGFTQSHQVWIDTHPHMEAFDAVVALSRCNIIANTIQAPTTPGRLALRVGVQEITYHGADKTIMEEIADIFEKRLIKKRYSEKDMRLRVSEIKKRLRLPFDKTLADKIMTLLSS